MQFLHQIANDSVSLCREIAVELFPTNYPVDFPNNASIYAKCILSFVSTLSNDPITTGNFIKLIFADISLKQLVDNN